MNPKAQTQAVAIIGCGWLGTPLALRLISEGTRVIATRSSEETAQRIRQLGIPTIPLALLPEVECPQLPMLRPAEIAIILLPPRARGGKGALFPEKIFHLLDELKKAGLKKIIFVSSTSVYPSENREIDESSEGRSDSLSGEVLIAAEQLVRQDPALQSTIIRFAGLCGPEREPGRLLAGKRDIPGAANPVNLIHQDDAIDLLITVLRKQPWGRIYNACAPTHPAKIDLYPEAARKLQLTPPQFNGAQKAYKIVRADKICADLGFVYRHPDPLTWKW